MIAVDTNVLVHAHRGDSSWNDRAYARLTQLVESGAPWAIPWPCVHEFFGIATNPRMWGRRPSTPAEALDQLQAWMSSPSLALLGESENYWAVLRDLVTTARVRGGQIHDARIAAICLAHGVRELWTSDRDFGRFPALSVRNPLASGD